MMPNIIKIMMELREKFFIRSKSIICRILAGAPYYFEKSRIQTRFKSKWKICYSILMDNTLKLPEHKSCTFYIFCPIWGNMNFQLYKFGYFMPDFNTFILDLTWKSYFLKKPHLNLFWNCCFLACWKLLDRGLIWREHKWDCCIHIPDIAWFNFSSYTFLYICIAMKFFC